MVFWIKIVTSTGGLIAFLWGIYIYQADTRIKRAEFLDKLIKEFLNPDIDIARNMLDDYVYVEKENRNRTPAEQKAVAKPLALFLRDHTTEPIGLRDEIAVRKSFDKLLDFFTRLSYYAKQKLITREELSYFRYYVDKIENKPEVIAYLKRYYYMDDFNHLFSR